MRREGSPWQGLGVVVLKELSDHLSSWRMRVLEWLVVLTAIMLAFIFAILRARAGHGERKHEPQRKREQGSLICGMLEGNPNLRRAYLDHRCLSGSGSRMQHHAGCSTQAFKAIWLKKAEAFYFAFPSPRVMRTYICKNSLSICSSS